ncbi:DUF4625 domain-containing protein [Reichenbachiella agarivorans]|uniref:DUF4625 domain-containing protein n=1 Tax=Reichenbachiella agarivorans TaxID=2979464 RepID=A0ABY6CRM1_9BACT|nr:DUF4625 domain-containing protein [Reichenbachiella agarivorans]UXP32989.1 DUF4625 domain-containing protein [Reichenbachiella agarivorans]
MKLNLILLMTIFLLTACDKDDNEVNDDQAPYISDILHDGINVKGDAFETFQGEKLQITIIATDGGFIESMHVTVRQTESTGEGLNTTSLEYNETFTIDQYETATQVVLIAAEISETTDLGVYQIDVEVTDDSGNASISTTSFTLIAATIEQ